MQYFGFDRPSFALRTLGFGANFDPLDLFAGDKQGVWYDPSDKSTLFQDVSGAVPVTKDGDPVGLILDKSQGLKLGNELVDNGYFNSGIESWSTDKATLSTTDGVLFFNSEGESSSFYQVMPDLPEGKIYKVSVDVISSNLTYNILCGNGIAQGQGGNTGEVVGGGVGNRSLIVDGGVGSYITIYAYGAGTMSFNSISVKEIASTKVTQTISAKRPTHKTNGAQSWLYNDKVDDNLTVTLPAMTATVVKATDEGVSIDYPVSITAGNRDITSTSTLGRDFGRLIIDRELTADEKTQVTAYFNTKRGA